MKKVLALLLALCMVFALVACGGGSSTPAPADDSGKQDTTPAAPDEGKKDDAPAPDEGTPADEGTDTVVTPHMNEDGSRNLDMIGYFDLDFDYASGPSYKIAYVAQSATVLYQQTAAAVETWAPRFNMQWLGFTSAENDNDMFMTQVQVLLDQGVDILLLDPDTTIYPAVANLLADYPEVQWMGNMGIPRDGSTGDGVPAGGQLLKNFAGKDYYGAGVLCGQKLYDWLNETYPDAARSEVGIILMNYSTSPQLVERYQGCYDKVIELMGEENVFPVDLVSYGLGVQAGIDGASPVISTNDNIKYWLVFGLVDDPAQGAASVISTAGLTDTSCCIAIGGAGLQTQCDAGQFDSFRFAYFTSYFMSVEPMMGAMYAFKRGFCTEDEIWPSWVKTNDHGGEGRTLSTLYIPAIWIGQNDYFEFLEWVDLYSGGNYYDYDAQVTLDMYDPYPDVPDGWLG